MRYLARLSVAVSGAVLWCLSLCSSPTSAAVIVVPNQYATQTTSSDTNFPFNKMEARTQQLYSATEFSSLGSPEWITELKFRPHWESGFPFSVVLDDVQINLSTTIRTPSTMSNIFGDNIGADETTVFSGILSLSSSFVGPPPMEFDIVVPLQTPFLYDPTVGDLLLDVSVFSGTTSMSELSVVTDSPAVSRVISSDVDALGGPLVETGHSAVTQFITIPEPATLFLVITGGLLVMRRRR